MLIKSKDCFISCERTLINKINARNERDHANKTPRIIQEITLHLDFKPGIIRTEFIIYQCILGASVISAAILLYVFRKSTAKLPAVWVHSLAIKNFRSGITCLLLYLLIVFVCESIALYMSRHGIYNSYVLSINIALSTPFLFGFFYLHTQTTWKKYTYFILYAVPLGYLSIGGYFHPKSVLNGNTILIVYIPYFLASFIHLTDLLPNPKSAYFKFQLKVCLSLQFYTLTSLVITTFHWFHELDKLMLSTTIYYIHVTNINLYYFALGLIFLAEAFKLRRR